MTTKKSKPASLTSSLLARKGEAEPATAPYSIPESGRQPTADGVPAKGNGNGNGNGGDLGHALSAMSRRRSGDKPDDGLDSALGDAPDYGDETRDIETVEGAENGVHTDAAQPVSPADDVQDEPAPEMEDEVDLDLNVDVAVSPEDEPEDEGDAPIREDEPSAEEILLEGAVAEETSIDEAVIEASIAADNAAERIAAETAAAIEKAGTPESEEDLSGSDDTNTEAAADSDAGKIGLTDVAAPIAAAVAAEKLSENAGKDAPSADDGREAARDARLLRFVYAMAALTGIVAIVLYAGGWLRDVPTKGQTETSVASTAEPSESPTAGGTPATGDTPSAMETDQAAEPSGTSATGSAGEGSPSAMGGTDDGPAGVPSIPAAPPVSPPGAKTEAVTETMPGTTLGTTDEKPVASDSGLTTGGPAKAVESAVPPASSTETPSSETPAAGDGNVASAESDASSQPAVAAPAETPADTASIPQETLTIDTSGAAGADGTSGGPETASSSGVETGAAESDAVVVPTPITPESVAPPPVSTEPVRDVPNMRVLAPALVRPEPAETAPPTGSAPATTAPATPAPAEQQTAALPKAATAAPSGGPYRVQLASVSSEALAKREWGRLQKVFPDFFGDRTLVIEKKVIAGRGTFFRIQTGGYETLADARAVCSGLKAKKQGCLPVKR